MDNMEEIWKDIEGYEGLYQASSFGQVRRLSHQSKAPPQIRKTKCDKFRYDVVRLSKNGNVEMVSLHRLIAKLFLDAPPCCPTCQTPYEVNHKDENTHNNRADNLEYITHAENVKRSKEKRRRGLSKILTDEMVMEIKSLLSQNITYRTIGERFGVAITTISEIANGRNWKHIPDPLP